MKQFFMFSQRVVSLVVRHKAHLLVMKSYPLLIGDSFISHGNNRPPKINMDTQNDGPWKAGNGTLQKWHHFWYQFVRFLECKSLLSTSQLYHGKNGPQVWCKYLGCALLQGAGWSPRDIRRRTTKVSQMLHVWIIYLHEVKNGYIQREMAW